MFKSLLCFLIFLGCSIGLVKAQTPAERVDSGSSISGKAWFNASRPPSPGDLRSGPVVIEYWASWCSSCLDLVPQLNRLHQEYADRGLMIIAVTAESPDQVASYVRKFGIKYAVCAEATPADSPDGKLPYTQVLSSAGDVLWSGRDHDLYDRVSSLIQPYLSIRRAEFISEGQVIGLKVARPRDALNYDYADLFSLDAQADPKEQCARENLDYIFGFYWKNLPQGDWPGDEALRIGSHVWLAELARICRSDGVASDYIRQELIRRLNDHDVNTSYSNLIDEISAIFALGDPQVIAALESAKLRAQQDPLLLAALEDALDRLVPSRQSSKPPEKNLSKARTYYSQTSKKWTTKLFGWPEDLEPYVDYLKWASSLQSYQAMDPKSAIDELVQQFKKHCSTAAADLLIRRDVLDRLQAMSWPEPTVDVRRHLQLQLFDLFRNYHDPEWESRIRLTVALSSSGFEYLDRDELLGVVEAQLKDETTRWGRAYLKQLRLKLVGPAALD